MHKTMKNIFLLPVILPALILAGCKTDEIQLYEGKANVYFLYKMWPTSGFGLTATLEFEGKQLSMHAQYIAAQDSITHSFAFVDPAVQLDTTFIPVKLIGNLADHDRKIAYKINPGTDAGVEGTDFRVLDAFMPAGKTDGGIVVEMSRANLKAAGHMTVDFELLANEHFGLEFESIKRSATKDTDVPTTSFRLWYNDELPMPSNWSFSYQDYMGTWSPKKAYLLIEQFNISWGALYSPPHTAYIVSWGGQLKRYLEKMAAAGTPVMESDGVTPMTAGRWA